MSLNTAEQVSYSADKVRSGEIPFCLMLIAPRDRIISRVAPEATELSLHGFSEAEMNEINEHLYSYTEKMLLTENEGRIWGFLPSVYPSATLCVAIATDEALLGRADLLRLARAEELERFFTFSDSISTQSSRMSERLCEQKSRFEGFFSDLFTAFSGMSALEGADEESARSEIYKRIYAISRLTGCPVDNITEVGEGINDYTDTDLPLFVAFLFSFLAFARTNADLRKVSISLGASSSAAIITLGFGTKKAITLSDELIEWEGLTAERNMMFGYRSEADNVEITFQPLRRDWSLLGLKQKISLFE